MQQQAELPSLGWGLLLPPAVVLGLWKRPLLPLTFFIAGVFWASLRAGIVLAEHLPVALEGRDLAVEGYVADIPKPGERGLRFEFEVAQASLDGQAVRLPRRIQLSSFDATLNPAVGERWALSVRLKRPHGFQNPGGFDYEAHLFQHRIRALGYVRAREPPRRVDAAAAAYPLGRFRHRLSQRIQELLPESPAAGLITAFANGDESAIADSQWRVLGRTGTTHLVAISGMNIGLVAGLVFLLARRAWSVPAITLLRLPAPKAAALAALAAGAFYAALAGFAIPTQRALVMLGAVLGGILLGRRIAPSQLLATALVLVLVLDPLSVMSAGFWLSFAAVALILYVTDGRRARDWRERLHAWGRVQWAVGVGMLPLTLMLFQQASLSGPLANLLAIPVIELIVIPATLIGVLVSALPDAAAALPFRLAALALEGLWPALEYLSGLDHSLWVQHTPRPWTLAAAAVGIAWLLAPRGFPARWVGTLWLLPLFLIRPPAPAPGEVWFTLLDVGQGLSAVVRTAHHALVYDAGPRFSARFDAGRAAVAPFLRHAGIGRIDTLVISHEHNDHIGGAASLIETFPVGRIVSSVPQRLTEAEPCRAGESWEWDGVRLALLHPADEPGLRDNNLSCVLAVTGPYGRILLPGDIAAAAERVLVARAREALRAEVLVVPHHGSKSSSSAPFIDAVRPEYALIPAGYRNAYRHPNAQVVERYRSAGARLYGSAAAGAIALRLTAAGREVAAYRVEQARYWRTPPDVE